MMNQLLEFTMSTITHVKDVPMVKKMFAAVLILAGLFVFIKSSFLFGGIAIAIGLNLIGTEGAEINLENKTFRKIKSIFGLHFGTWKPIPKFEYISVFKTKENQTINIVTATTTITSDIIVLNLFYDRNKHITFYKTDDKSDAFAVAEHIKRALDIDIIDATGVEKKRL